jgi:cytochrome b561
MERSKSRPESSGDLVYSPTARRFHWLTVAVVAVQIPLGLYMVWRGNQTNFDDATARLYDLHKLLGFSLLWLMVARLAYRFRHGAPPDEPTLEWWHKAASHLTHWGIYGLLLVIPLLGWVGVSLYGARTVFGLVTLPPLAPQDQDASVLVFQIHYYAALLLLAAIAAHVSAAIYHHFIRKDGVLRRMLPGLARRE